MGQVIALPQPPKMGKLPPKRVRNSERRSREYLSPAEMDAMITAAKNSGRHGHRDATLILLAYRHAARVSELACWRRDQVDLAQGLLHVNRLKNGTPSVHPLRGPEIRALRKLFRDYPGQPLCLLYGAERTDDGSGSQEDRRPGRGTGGPLLPSPSPHAPTRHGLLPCLKGQDTRAIQAYMVTRTSRTRSGIRSCRQRGSRASGVISAE